MGLQPEKTWVSVQGDTFSVFELKSYQCSFYSAKYRKNTCHGATLLGNLLIMAILIGTTIVWIASVGHFTIGIMGGTQKIACHSDVTWGSVSVRICIKTLHSKYFYRSETQL